MAYRDPAVRRQRDRERFRKRTAERVAQGLCPRCGDGPPAPERSVCDPCGEKRNKASRARDARLRAEGRPRRDPVKARACESKRSRRETERRFAQGLCTRCGKATAAPDRTSCEPCLEKRRADDRARYARGKAAGKLYGGANPEAKRRSGRTESKRRQKARREAGLCTRCGGPIFDGLSRCGPCTAIDEASHSPERKNARSRKLYVERRARGLCTACGAPSQGASRCTPCAERSYHRSDHFRGIPIWDPSWTVIELATGREHGPFDSQADVSLCLAFAKLVRRDVEIVEDASPMSQFTAWA